MCVVLNASNKTRLFDSMTLWVPILVHCVPPLLDEYIMELKIIFLLLKKQKYNLLF